MSFDLKLHAYRLLMDEPFFAALSRKIEKRADYNIPTAGVRVDPESAQFEMIYNPDFFASLPEEHVRGVLKHEFYHLIFEHVTGTRFAHFRDLDASERRIHNVGMDLAINSHIADLPKGACIPGDGPFVDMPRGMSEDWYMKNLPTPKEQDSSQGEGEGDGMPEPLDDHSGWDQVDNTENEIAKERLKEAIKKAWF